MHAPRILAFAGSTREGSYNRRLLAVAAAAASAAGGDVTILDLGALALPLYDAGREEREGLPPGATQLKTAMAASEGLLIASPEYNSSVTALLKNAIDWASRPAAGEAPLAAFRGKVAALLAASPGALGGLRGLVHLRAILGNIQVLVLPDQVAVPQAHDAFTAEGALQDAKRQEAVARLAVQLVTATAKLNG